MENQNTEKSLPDDRNEEKENNPDIQNNKDTAAASYFLILSPVLLFTRKDSAFIQHHASQAFVLLLIFILLWFLGGYFVFFSWLTVGVFFMAFIGFIQAIQGEKYEIPYIYEMVKDGVSFNGIVAGVKKTSIAIGAVIVGLFPKKTQTNLKKTINDLQTTNNSDLEKRVKKLEQEIEDIKKRK